MSAPERFVLDSNVFIEAKNRYYAFDVAPAFWEALLDHAKGGRVVSIDRVRAELDRGKDALTDWAAGKFSQWFESTATDACLATYREIMEWTISAEQFSPAAKEEFAEAENADPWVVAFAMATGSAVVTQETFSSDVKNRIPVPNVCRAMSVPCVDTFQMLKQLGVRLG